MTGRTTNTGFTLMEVLVAVAIVGMAFVGVLLSMKSSTMANSGASDMTTAVLLAQQIREMSINMPFSDPDAADVGKDPGPDGSDPNTFVDDLDDLLGHTYCPPRSSMPINSSGSNRVGTVMNDYPLWSQSISITYRNPQNIAEITYPRAVDPLVTDLAMVQVVIRKENQIIYTTQWLVARPREESE